MVAFLLVLPFQTPGQAEWDVYFEDVPIENSHYSNIYYLADKGIIKGYPSEGYDWIFDFKPANDVTKRQVAAMLVRALGLSGSAPDPGFKDVTTKDGAYNDIALAVKHGLFKKSTHFKPGSSITREEMAYALVRAFNLKGQSKLTFSDVPKSHAAYSDVQALAANHITTGSDGKFNPKANLTRAQFASFVARAILPEARPTQEDITFGYVPEVEGKTYTYRLYHGGGYETLVYDHVRFDSYQGFNRTLLLTNSQDEYTEMGYFENNQAVQFDVPFDGYSRLFVLEYPVKAGKEFYFNDVSEDNVQGKVTHQVNVLATNGIHKIEDTIYTNVTIAKNRFRYQYDDATVDVTRVFYLTQEHGIIAVELFDAMLELERIDD